MAVAAHTLGHFVQAFWVCQAGHSCTPTSSWTPCAQKLKTSRDIDWTINLLPRGTLHGISVLANGPSKLPPDHCSASLTAGTCMQKCCGCTSLLVVAAGALQTWCYTSRHVKRAACLRACWMTAWTYTSPLQPMHMRAPGPHTALACAPPLPPSSPLAWETFTACPGWRTGEPHGGCHLCTWMYMLQSMCADVSTRVHVLATTAVW